MTDSVRLLPAQTGMTVEQCLSYCSLEQKTYTDVMILAYDVNGELITRSSNITRADALWLLEQAKLHTLGL